MKRPTTGETLRQRSVKIRKDQDEALDELAYRSRKSFSEYLREVIDYYLEQRQRGNHLN
jgi:predicted DNA-binding protein